MKSRGSHEARKKLAAPCSSTDRMIVTVATRSPSFPRRERTSGRNGNFPALSRPYTAKSAITGIQVDQYPTINNARSPVDSIVVIFSPRRARPRQRKTDCRCAEIISWKFLMQRARARLTKSIIICCVNYGRKWWLYKYVAVQLTQAG